MKFQEISDVQWKTIKKHLPKPAKTGNQEQMTVNN
jgi:hypothetical protein